MSKKKQTEATEAEQKAAEQAADAAEQQAASAETAAQPDDEWKAKFDELNDRYLRMAAEYDNFRKRSQREREQAYTDAVSRAVTALLPTYDNLERAIKAETADAEYKKGVEMTMTQLTESLKGLNVTVIEASAGTTFDPNFHNAVMHVEDESLGENVIAEVFQQGFQIGDKVIRHAMVKVAN
ncbi:MAG TPA: nucleotide exchange factor GrpE [Candidatus Agathobaculum pullistercoris]|nr:nucleotide exchange factor GrpE [uncultured Agathobaculum sp.]HIX11374.1 nucleotide exchange factor GrpE [Candidatus Agathobaculum pullistercoris]